MVLHPLALATFLLTPLVAQQSTEGAEEALRSAIGSALQGNAAEAVTLLEQVPPSEFSEKDRAIRACIIDRFSSAPQKFPVKEPGLVIQQALDMYRSYWRASLLRPEAKTTEEEELTNDLRTLLELPADASWERVETELKMRSAAEGHQVLMGRTPPLLELIVWRSEESDVRQVPLPEGEHLVKVTILDDFASLGWSAYATCDRSFTGGWVKPEAIYAVRPGWKDLTAENFQISFLAHESQHFADKQRFGELESWELEYRAKLAELALADATLSRILSAFRSNQSDDPSVPHSYANRIVLARLVSELEVTGPEALSQISPEEVSGAAKALLIRDTASRE